MNHSTLQTFLGLLKALLALTLICVSNWSFADEASAPLDVAKEGIFTPAYLMQSFAGLVIVIGLILILAMLFRRFGDQGLGPAAVAVLNLIKDEMNWAPKFNLENSVEHAWNWEKKLMNFKYIS